MSKNPYSQRGYPTTKEVHVAVEVGFESSTKSYTTYMYLEYLLTVWNLGENLLLAITNSYISFINHWFHNVMSCHSTMTMSCHSACHAMWTYLLLHCEGHEYYYIADDSWNLLEHCNTTNDGLKHNQLSSLLPPEIKLQMPLQLERTFCWNAWLFKLGRYWQLHLVCANAEFANRLFSDKCEHISLGLPRVTRTTATNAEQVW